MYTREAAVAEMFAIMHRAGAVLVLVGAAVTLVWGLHDDRQGKPFTWQYDRALWVVQALLLGQVACGVGAYVLGTAASLWHLAVGSLAALLPLLVWLHARRGRRLPLVMATVSALNMVFVLVGAVTAGRSA